MPMKRAVTISKQVRGEVRAHAGDEVLERDPMSAGYERYEGRWEDRAQLAWDTLALKATRGIPHGTLNIMDWDMLVHLAGAKPGDYERMPDDVRKELRWVVEKGPKVGLFLSATSSIAPGTKPENVLTFIEGLEYYRE